MPYQMKQWKLERAEKWRHKKYVNIWHLTCKTHIPKLLYLINRQIKFKNYGHHTAPSYSYYLSVCKIWWRSGVIQCHCWRVRRLTCKIHISIFLASKVCPMLKYSDIYDIWEPILNYCNIQWTITNFCIHTPGRARPVHVLWIKNVTYVSDFMSRQ